MAIIYFRHIKTHITDWLNNDPAFIYLVREVVLHQLVIFAECVEGLLIDYQKKVKQNDSLQIKWKDLRYEYWKVRESIRLDKLNSDKNTAKDFSLTLTDFTQSIKQVINLASG